MPYKPPKPYDPPVASEDVEQECLFKWANASRGKYPILRWLYHIPNGGSRHKPEAAKLVRMGVKAGVSDIFLPSARGGYFGLYIELKRRKGGRTTNEQQEFIAAAQAEGYAAVVCKGAEEAEAVIKKYLGLSPTLTKTKGKR